MATVRMIGNGAAKTGARIRWRVAQVGPVRAAFISFFALALVVLLAFMFLRSDGDQVTVEPVESLTQTEVNQIVQSMTRYGVGRDASTIDAIYAAPGLLTLLDGEEPAAGRLVFFSTESIHEDQFEAPPTDLYLQLDDGPRIEPVERRLTANDIHHRTTRFEFVVSESTASALIDGSAHRLTLVADTGDGLETATSRFVWNLPADLPEELAGVTAASLTGETAEKLVGASALSKALRRTEKGVEYGGVSEIEFSATFATSEYFRTSMPAGADERYLVDERLVFLVSESTHTENLPADIPVLLLTIDGKAYTPIYQERRVASPHHRVTLVSFPIDPAVADATDTMFMALPGGQTLEWALPITYDAGNLSPFGVTWGTILALLAGLLASMWPCLFQLTVFFIPTLAGLNMEEVSGKITIAKRAVVVKAALFFVLGFTLVYTAAGAIIGYASQQLGDSPDFEQYQRYFGIGAGILIIILAVRVAAKVRAPLVCKMPVLSGMSRKARTSSASPIELMLAGIAFATGCMTCFGAAMVVAMVVYVGMSSSALFGATILFLFSLGMAIPLVIAAVAMSRVLPLVFKLEKIVPWMGLASSILMVGFAVLLISGNYMVITEFFWRITGNPLGG